MEIRLDGRTALITGGSKGLGLAMATRFAQSGAEVAMLARGAQALGEAERAIRAKAQTRVKGFACDVAKADELARTWKDVIAEFGKVDILINNAGTSRTGPFEEITDAIWQEDFDLKLFGAIRLARLALPDMKKRRWGRIINVLNVGAKAPRPGSAPTAVTRAAGLALTKILSGEGAPHNVLVNAMLVGLIRSDQHVQRFKGENRDIEEGYRERGAPLPMGRFGEAEEFANLACFLVSDAGSYVTGTAINVDGGMSPVV
ncbi:MAG TPA: SDR family oxidoreductase [Stellaceae bacterium]|nr:SDR family oxidoreductase [Stellaceae bacterium]